MTPNEKPASPTQTGPDIRQVIFDALDLSEELRIECTADVVNALESAGFYRPSPTQGELAVKVKPLQWIESTTTNDCGDKTYRYGASPLRNWFYWIFQRPDGKWTLQGYGSFDTLSEAQSHAQADFEARILSALDRTTLPPTEEEPEDAK